MFKLDDSFLQSVGLGGMPDNQKETFLQHLLDELEARVGTRLSEGMTNEKLLEFENLVDTSNDEGALAWLETNRPEYKKIVAEEIDKIQQEVLASKDKILNS